MALAGAFFGRLFEKRAKWMEWENMYRGFMQLLGLS